MVIQAPKPKRLFKSHQNLNKKQRQQQRWYAKAKAGTRGE